MLLIIVIKSFQLGISFINFNVVPSTSKKGPSTPSTVIDCVRSFQSISLDNIPFQLSIFWVKYNSLTLTLSLSNTQLPNGLLPVWSTE